MARAACRSTNWRSHRFLSSAFPWHFVSWFTMPLSYLISARVWVFFLCHIKFGLLFLKYPTLGLWSNGMSFISQITAKKRLLNTVNKTKCQAAQTKVQIWLSLQSNTNTCTTRTWHYSEITLIYFIDDNWLIAQESTLNPPCHAATIRLPHHQLLIVSWWIRISSFSANVLVLCVQLSSLLNEP